MAEKISASFLSLQSFATLKKLCCCNWETGKKYSGYKKWYLLYYLKLKSNWNVILIFISEKNLNQPWRLGVCTCLRYECFWRDFTGKVHRYLVYKNFKFEEITNPPSLSRHIFCVSKNPSIRYVDILSIKYGWIAKYYNDIRVKILYYAQQNL